MEIKADEMTGRTLAPPTSPSLRREMREKNISEDELAASGKGGRITLDDLFARIEEKSKMPPPSRPARIVESEKVLSESQGTPSSTPVSKVSAELSFSSGEQSCIRTEEPPIYSSARKESHSIAPVISKVAAVSQESAILTIFDEVDLSREIMLCKKYCEYLFEFHGINYGCMPFFVKACVKALKEFPTVNVSIDGDVVECQKNFAIGLAIGNEKLPVLHGVDKLKLHEIDQAIATFIEKLETNHLDCSGADTATFIIRNAGLYGAISSTPLLNRQHGAVLGIHCIQERPVVRDGQIVVRPMMNIALSYDERVVGSCQAIQFLKRIKDIVEEPEELLEDN